MRMAADTGVFGQPTEQNGQAGQSADRVGQPAEQNGQPTAQNGQPKEQRHLPNHVLLNAYLPGQGIMPHQVQYLHAAAILLHCYRAA